VGLIALPYTLTPGTTARAGEVMADLVAIISAANGNLDGDNIATGNSVATGPSTSSGSGTDIALANHTHAVQGMEALSADPVTGNFVGREYFNTSTLKVRLCVATGGVGTWLTTGNLSASELPAHGSRHATGGGDPLAANSVDATMRASQTVATATQASDVLLPASTWTTIVDLSVSTTNAQTLACALHNQVVNSSGSAQPTVFFRVQDHTASDVTIFRSERTRLDTTATGNDRQTPGYTFYYTTPSGGARTLRLQAWCGTNNVITVTKPTTIGGDATIEPNIKAVIV
jgi:hypothetical protein